MKLTSVEIVAKTLLLRILPLILFGIVVACSPSSLEKNEEGSGVGPDPKDAPASLAELVGSMDYSGRALDPPRALPSFSLVDQNGDVFGSYDLGGKSALISFAYTNCPDVCPVLFGQYISVQNRLGDRIGDDVILVVITVDPERDTPARLADRTDAMGGKWRYLTGDRRTLERVWEDFQVRVEPEGEFVGHTGVTYLLTPDGWMPIRFPAFATADHFLRGLDQEVPTAPVSQAPGVPAGHDVTESQFTNAWVRSEIDPTSIYLTIRNGGDSAIKFVSASADWAESVTIHQTVERDGLIKMEHLDELIIPADGSIDLVPGGIHLMARGLSQPLIGDETVKVKLFTASGDIAEFTANVRD